MNRENQIKAVEARCICESGRKYFLPPPMPSRRLFAQPVMKAFSPNSRHNGNNKSLTHTYTREPESRAEEREIQHSTFRIAAHAEEKVNFLRRLLPTPPTHRPTHSALQSETSIVSLIAKFVSLCGGSPVVRCLIKVGLRRGLSSLYYTTFDDKLFSLSQF